MEDYKFYLQADFQKERQEVTIEEFIMAERQAEFHPKHGNGLATGGFSGNGVNGSIELIKATNKGNGKMLEDNINFLTVELKEILKGHIFGKYLRKRGKDGIYDPSDGWHRKWTHKIGWVGGGDHLRLVAMTDGMISQEFSKGSLSVWIHENDMVFMTREEMVSYMENTYIK